MQSITLQSRVGSDGILNIQVPSGLSNVDVEVVVVVQPITLPSNREKSQPDGWPEGFFERTYGAFRDDPLERGPQGELETRDEIL